MSHVLIIGASIGGMAAAKALAKHASKITILERDALDPSLPHRSGAPQSQHQHALLERGRIEFEELYPGFSERLMGGGAHLINPGLDFAFFGPEGWMKRQSGVEALFQSRSLLESTLRQMAGEQIAALTIEPHQEVIGLLHDSGKRVLGVKVRDRNNGVERQIEADLVVDASGRSSRSLAWLEELGGGLPEETVVDAFCGYSSRWYAAPESLPAGWWWKAAYCAPTLDNPLGGSLAPLEGGRWLVTTWGYERQYPPTDPDGFDELLRHGLRTPLLYEMTRLAEPISPIYSFKGFVNRRRWFSRWAGLPSRYLTVGDIGCVFNPVHGQGMTSAVLAARELATVIAEHGFDHPELGRLYYRAAEKVQDNPAQLSCGYDLKFPSAVGERPRFFAANNWFFDRYADAAQDHPDLYIKLMRVMHLLDSPASLAAPANVGRVLTHALRSGLGKGVTYGTTAMPAFNYTEPPIRHPAGPPVRDQQALSWRPAKIAAKRQEAERIYSFVLESADGEPLPPFTAGAHIDVKLGSLIRQYSLCNGPAEDGRFLICAQHEADSRGGSRMLCDQLREGDTIEWRGPRQMFALADTKAPSLLIAGGIGITPLLAMAETLSAEGTDFELHLFVRNEARTPFRDRLASAPYARSVFIHRDDAPPAERSELGHILKHDGGRHVYICGPGGFIDNVLQTAKAAGWPDARVHNERFSSGAVDTSDNKPFTIELARSGRVIEVPAERSALAALNDAGCVIPASCETGVCGTCATPLIDGEADHRDTFLTAAERAEGRLFIPCCSRAKSEKLVLDA